MCVNSVASMVVVKGRIQTEGKSPVPNSCVSSWEEGMRLVYTKQDSRGYFHSPTIHRAEQSKPSICLLWGDFGDLGGDWSDGSTTKKMCVNICPNLFLKRGKIGQNDTCPNWVELKEAKLFIS